MHEAKDILLTVIKSPSFIPLLVTLIVSNQKWLLPQIPEDVVSSFLNLLTMILGAIVIYYAGKSVQKNEYQRAMKASRLHTTKAEPE